MKQATFLLQRRGGHGGTTSGSTRKLVALLLVSLILAAILLTWYFSRELSNYVPDLGMMQLSFMTNAAEAAAAAAVSGPATGVAAAAAALTTTGTNQESLSTTGSTSLAKGPMTTNNRKGPSSVSTAMSEPRPTAAAASVAATTGLPAKEQKMESKNNNVKSSASSSSQASAAMRNSTDPQDRTKTENARLGSSSDNRSHSGGTPRTKTDAGVDVSDPALYAEVDLHGDSSTATVMGLASGYTLNVYQRFVGSLRHSGYKGHIILGVQPGVPAEVLEYFEYRNVTPKILEWVPCTYKKNEEEKRDIFKETTCAHPYPDIKVRWSRFPLGRDWLESCTTCTGPVLAMDVRDSYFQLDPFGPGSPPIKGLQVVQEHPVQRTTHWLTNWPIKDCKGLVFDEPMLCSGTTIGTRAAMIKYLEVMYEEMKVWINEPKCRFDINGDDQSIHNYLFYTGQLPFATSVPYRACIVNTVGKPGADVWKQHIANLKAKRLKVSDRTYHQMPYPGASNTTWIGIEYNMTDADGYFIEYDGSRSRVVHQFDRWGRQLEGWLNKQKWTRDPIPPGWKKRHQ